MSDTPSAKNAGTDSTPTKRGAFRRVLFGTLKWVAIITVVWIGLSLIVPGMPSPLIAARALFGGFKVVSDDVYGWAKNETLARAADEVRNEAVEAEPPAQTPDIVTVSDERKSHMPIVRPEEDSTVRAQMKAISNAPPIRGRVINILLFGIDSRMGVRNSRADAIHLFTINPDSAVVEIMSIPRDTFVDLGYPDTTRYNIIANARARGYEGFMNKVSEVSGRGPIKYYVEIGFSQAMGVLEMLGYKDPVSTLKFLRTRKTMAAGDIQRSHNQAVFLRQNLMGKFGLLTGATGDVLLSAGLHFVTTNLTKEFCQGLIYAMQERNFPHHRTDAVRLRMPSIYKFRLKDMVADSATVARTMAMIDRRVDEEDNHIPDVAQYLRKQHRLALADTARPGRVITRLSRLNEQRAWVQIQDRSIRRELRDAISTTLESAYRRVGKTADADKVMNARRAEDLLLGGDTL